MELTENKVKIYHFEKEEEIYYGFVLIFEEQNPLYTPFLTNSKESIEYFTDAIEFAEVIQDNGSQYEITSNAIIFKDEASAKIASDYLLSIVVSQHSKSYVEAKLYEFAKRHYFGKGAQILDELEYRFPDGYNEEDKEAFYAELQTATI